MKKVILISFILPICCITVSLGQEQFYISQYYQTQAIFNPGFTGIDDFLDVKIGYRKKWAGVNSSPSTAFISVMGSIGDKTSYNQSPIRISNPNQYEFIEGQKNKISHHGLGGYITEQGQGAFNQTNVMVNYAYHIPLNSKIKASLGASIGLSSIRVDLNKIEVWDKLNDPLYQAYANSDGKYSRFLINLGGVIYGKKSYLGISYLPVANIPLSGNDQDLLATNNFVILTGTKFDMGPSLKLLPSILMETNFNQNSKFVGSLLLDIKSLIKTGFSYSSLNDISFNLFINYKNEFGLSYSFETSLGGENTIGNGTHEVILSFNLFNNLNATHQLW